MTAPETSSAKNKRKKIVDDDINAHLDVKTQLANKLNKKTRREKTRQGSPRSSAGSDHADVDVTSCCSFNNFSELAEHEERNNDDNNNNNSDVDQNEESDDEDSDQAQSRSTYNPLRESKRGMGPNNSDNLRRQQRPEESGGRGSTTVENPKMPTESELEEFFTAAEKDIQSKFSIKYNYDVTKDEALEGRYEWSRLKP